MHLRKASSMLELVIAIVVMGIAMMTLPLMLTRVQSNNEFAMQQEAILMARTELGDILTYPWDENSTDSSLNVGVLDTTNGDGNFSRYPDSNSTRRKGHVKADKRRKFFTTPRYATSSLGQESGESIPDDIDDFNTSTDINLTTTHETNETNATLGYKVSDSNMSISVRYLSDSTRYTNGIATFDINTSATPPTGTTNLKLISVALKNTLLGDGNITLRAFSANIGANQLLRRTF